MHSVVASNLGEIQEIIRGKSTHTVKVVGVTKNRTPEEIRELREQGIVDMGENRVQEFLRKIENTPQDIRWHFIGHLQRNKVKYLVKLPQLSLIHSVDSLRLARKISSEAEKADRVMPVLLQINIAEEKQKHGFFVSELWEVLDEIDSLENIDVKGLMTMAPFAEDPEQVRSVFASLRKLSEEISNHTWNNIEMKELSMGMSQDYSVAIEEGATIVRLGRILFAK